MPWPATVAEHRGGTPGAAVGSLPSGTRTGVLLNKARGLLHVCVHVCVGIRPGPSGVFIVYGVVNGACRFQARGLLHPPPFGLSVYY